MRLKKKFRKLGNMEWNYYIKYLEILFLILTATIFLCYWEELTSFQILFSSENYPSNLPNSSCLQRDNLQTALENCSTADKTVIIVVINEAYVKPPDNEYPPMFDLFLEGFWVGEQTRPLLRRLLVVSMDRTAHERCVFRGLNCYLLAAEGGFASEKLYMTGEFIEMMWRRTAFLLDVLKRGYSFIFTDADVIWLRDPFARLMKNGTFDFQISTDKFNGDPSSEKNPINTGFYMIQSSKGTTSLFQKWYDMRTNSTGMKEQDVLQKLMIEGAALTEFSVRTRFLDTEYFGGFCSSINNPASTVIIHANCCRTIKAKIVDLKKVLMASKSIKGNSGNTTSGFQYSEHTACINSWSPKNNSLNRL